MQSSLNMAERCSPQFPKSRTGRVMAYKIEEFSYLFQTADYVTKRCIHSFCVDSIYSMEPCASATCVFLVSLHNRFRGTTVPGMGAYTQKSQSKWKEMEDSLIVNTKHFVL